MHLIVLLSFSLFFHYEAQSSNKCGDAFEDPLTAEVIEKTPPEKIKKIPLKLIEEMPIKELQKISLKRMEDMISQMDPEQIVTLVSRFQNMTSDQKILMDDILQTNHLFLDSKNPVPIELLQKLIPYMNDLPSKQIEAIPPNLIKSIPPEMVKNIPARALYSMKLEQIEAMTTQQKSALTALQMQYLGSAHVEHY